MKKSTGLASGGTDAFIIKGVGKIQMKEDKRVLAEILKIIRLLAVLILAAGICMYAYTKYKSSQKPELTSSFINGKLEAASELVSSELFYTGLIKYSEGKIPLLTKNSFSMLYTATVRAGIDLSAVQASVSDDEVVIVLPQCSVQSVEIDKDSIEFYDERFALFNWTEKTDVIDAVSAAEEDVMQKADLDSLLEHAQLQAQAIVKGLLEDAVGDRRLDIR